MPYFVKGIQDDILKPLELNTEIALSISPTLKVLVTLIDANHIPGSVMVLIKGYFGNILYTGDFRYDLNMLNVLPLKEVINREDMDEIYLDNTFFYPTCDFASRQEILEKIVSLVTNHPEYHIYIGIRKIGKEEVLVEIAKRLRERIFVSQAKFEMLKLMNYPDVFTTDPNTSRIHCLNFNALNRKFMQKESSKRLTLGIVLTALYYGWDSPSIAAPYSYSKSYGLHVLEYSDHSAYSELQEFVKAIKPKIVKPIINNVVGWGMMRDWPNFLITRINMSPLKPYLSKGK